MLFRLDRREEALPYLERALAVDQAHYGECNASVARDLHGLGVVLAALGDRDAARERLRQAHDCLARDLPPDAPALAALRHDLARLGEDPGS